MRQVGGAGGAGEIDTEALLIADGAGEVIILLNESIRSVIKSRWVFA